jgi:hypothetical protein
MSSRALEASARAAAVNRQVMFGKSAVYGTAAFSIALTGITSRKQLQEAGFQLYHDTIGRVLAGGAPAFALGGKITYSGRQYRIDEIVTHPVNPEIRLGLKQL